MDVNRTMLRVTYFLLTGFLVGYLAEQEKELRAEIDPWPTPHGSHAWISAWADR